MDLKRLHVSTLNGRLAHHVCSIVARTHASSKLLAGPMARSQKANEQRKDEE